MVRSGNTIAPVVLREKEKLTDTNTKILGAILNDVKPYRSDYYYYKYYRYYGEETKRRKETKRVSLRNRFKRLVKNINGKSDKVKNKNHTPQAKNNSQLTVDNSQKN